ncbi:MAG: DNA repair protein RecN [Desulfuromonadales bacterium]|nr:DNA repair protein RecN [Desulfuromonadales bacterium]
MLIELTIRNFATIDRLHVAFRSGFNVLTGETGAGKSIIIDAVGLLLGDRARPELIRSDADEASVEALIDLADAPQVLKRLADEGFAEGDELLIRRTMNRSGKNRVYLNGALVTLTQLQTISADLMVIYGQHEQQQLQRSAAHLDLLDRYAGLKGDVQECGARFFEVHTLQQRIEKLALAERDRQHRLDLLTFQQQELEQAALQIGEDEELEVERRRLLNAGQLAEVCNSGYAQLYEDEGAICERLALLATEQESLVRVDPVFAEMAELVRQAQYGLEDVASRLRDYVGQVIFDPERQNAIEERLALIANLKRKYASAIVDILACKKRIEAELSELANLDATQTALLGQFDTAKARLQKAAAELSRKRSAAAAELSGAVTHELFDLAMQKARFEVQLDPLDTPEAKGGERCQFYLSANPGEPPKPLSRIASGGELSRIMLAIRRSIPQAGGTTTLIFDEVDAGIGGVAASKVGEKLQSVACGLQVLCVTHLPQVAAFADWHYRVEKEQSDAVTRTTLAILDPEERVTEMARMLGGAKITERTLEHAREMVAASKQIHTGQRV